MRKIFCLVFLAAALFAVQALADDVTLRWDANTEADLAGYKVYYKIDGAGAPYDGNTADQGASPIIITLADDEDPDPTVVVYTITGLRTLAVSERYRFAVTAYDSEQTDPPGGLESGFSNEVDTDGAPINPGNLVVVSSQ